MLFKHKILSGIWLMERSAADAYLPIISSYLKGNINPVIENTSSVASIHSVSNVSNGSEYLNFDRNEFRSMEEYIRAAPKDSILVLSISGAITKHDQYCGPEGMQSLAGWLKTAYQTENIAGIALKIDSGGGEGGAMRLLQDAIAERNKPVMAYIDDFACSAAYGIAAACDVVTANNELARIGSIGVYLSIVDYSEKLKKEGINLIEIYAPQSKDKNADVMGAIAGEKSALDELRKIAGTYCESFIQSVENSRNIQGRDQWGTGKVFFASEALELGLIDSIDSFENFLNYLNT